MNTKEEKFLSLYKSVALAEEKLNSARAELAKFIGLDVPPTTTVKAPAPKASPSAKGSTKAASVRHGTNKYKVLDALKGAVDGATAIDQAAITEKCKVKNPILSQICNQLVDAGLISRDRKGRGAKYQITADGTTAL